MLRWGGPCAGTAGRPRKNQMWLPVLHRLVVRERSGEVTLCAVDLKGFPEEGALERGLEALGR